MSRKTVRLYQKRKHRLSKVQLCVKQNLSVAYTAHSCSKRYVEMGFSASKSSAFS
jgi:hypothetical protein